MAERAGQHYARNVAHQLRTPLAGIRLRLEGLLPDLAGEAAEEVELVIAEVDRLAEVVDTLLALTRGGTAEWARATARAVLQDAATRWGALAARAGRPVQVADDAPVELLELPLGVLGQVLDVLVHNALRHGAGTVRLAARSGDGRLELTVQDDGALPDVADAELFARARPSRPNGEGIGLSLARELAALVGGELRVLDRAPTTFLVRVPAGTVDGV